MVVRIQCPRKECAQSVHLPETTFSIISIRCPSCRQPFHVDPETFLTASAPAYSSTVDAIPSADASSAAVEFCSSAETATNIKAGDPDTATVSFAMAVSSVEKTDGSHADALDGPQLGRFCIRQLLGEGAFGKVFEAYDPKLDRPIALKVAKAERIASASMAERFLREAKAAANLRHPNIVPIYDYGEEGRTLYIASAFVAGRTLETALDEWAAKNDLRRAIQAIRQLAHALAYAHTQGVVHRDVKPANVMVDHADQPMLMDFGLAARSADAEKLTHAGAIMGTPRYMAPEHARGHGGDAQPASDQYSLGIVLYEVLARRPPFVGSTEAVMLHHINTEPSAPRKFNKDVPLDLETICLRCLEKDPAKRFRDCSQLADELRRWLDGEPIQTRRVGWMERLGKWARRKPIVAGLAAAVIAVSAMGLGAVLHQMNQTNLALKEAVEERKKANGQKRLAEKQRQRADERATEAQKQTQRADGEAKRARDEMETGRRHLFVAHMNNLPRFYEDNDFLSLNATLDSTRPERMGGADLRGFEWYYWWRAANLHVQRLGASGRQWFTIFSRDGKQVVTHEDDALGCWDAVTGKSLQRLPHESLATLSRLSPDGKLMNAVNFVPSLMWGEPPQFSGDGKYLAARKHSEGGYVVWNFTTGQIAHVVRGSGFGFAPAKNICAVVDEGEISFRDNATGKILRTVKLTTPQRLKYLKVSPDGKKLASTDGRNVLVFSTEDGSVVRQFEPTSHPEHLLAGFEFLPDGKRFLTASNYGSPRVRIWDLDDGKELVGFGTRSPVTMVALNRDGRRVATCSSWGSATVFDSKTGAELTTIKGTAGSIVAIALSPDGKQLASCNGGSTVIWDLSLTADPRKSFGLTDRVLNVQFSPDGKRVAGDELVYDIPTRKPLLDLKGERHGKRVFSPDGERLAGASFNRVKVWNLTTGQLESSRDEPKGRLIDLAYTPSNRLLLLEQTSSHCQLREVGSGNVLRVFDNAKYGKLSDNGRFVGVMRKPSNALSRRVEVWDVESDSLAHPVFDVPQSNVGDIDAIALSPSGKLIAVRNGLRVDVWDCSQAKVLQCIPSKMSGFIEQVSFSHDDRRLALGSMDTSILLYDVATGSQVLKLYGQGNVHATAFSPCGKMLGAGCLTSINVFDVSLPMQKNPRLAGNDYADIGEWDRASECLMHALKAWPNHAGAIKSLSLVELMAGRYDRFREACRRGLELSAGGDESDSQGDTDIADIACDCALLPDTLENWAALASRLRSVVEKNPQSWTAARAYGAVLLRNGEPVAALQELHRAMSLAKEPRSVILLKALALAQNGSKIDAQPLLAEFRSWRGRAIKVDRLVFEGGSWWSLDWSDRARLDVLSRELTSKVSAE